MAIDRELSFRIPMNETEHRMLRELAEHEGTTATALVRGWLRREHARVFGEPKPRKGGRS
jgi:hypothetical protein